MLSLIHICASFFSCRAGGVVCADCMADDAILLSAPVFAAMRYILSEGTDKIFSFTILPPALEELGVVSEKFLLHQTEKAFPSLSYYKQIKD